MTGNQHLSRAVFLDRDGVIIEDTGFPHRPGQVRFLSGASDSIKLLNTQGFKVIVLTNQSGVARGYFGEQAVKEINEFIRASLLERGAVIDRTYYCPHHPEGSVEGYAVVCSCRKPNIGMVEQAARDFRIDLSRSFVIGDNNCDIELGRRAGCRTVLLNGPGTRRKDAIPFLASDHMAASLLDAVCWILESGDN